MRIVWDEPKHLINLDRHGLDFRAVTLQFFLDAIVRPAKKGRLQAIGTIGSEAVSLIFHPLGSEAVSLISMRRASVKERALL